MELERAEDLANELMGEHGLFDTLFVKDMWAFKFDNAKRRLGCCHYHNKTITLSRYFTKLNDESIIFDTILHEIAHAIVGYSHGHDEVWRAKAIEIGCSGKRTCSESIAPKGKYVAICVGCGKKNYIHRKKKRTSSCGNCSGGKFNPQYMLDFKINLDN